MQHENNVRLRNKIIGEAKHIAKMHFECGMAPSNPADLDAYINAMQTNFRTDPKYRTLTEVQSENIYNLIPLIEYELKELYRNGPRPEPICPYIWFVSNPRNF